MQLKHDHGFIAYSVSGSGVPLLFIHGYPLSRKIWDPQLSSLSEIAKVTTVDLRGHGETYAFEPPYSMELLADDCNELLDTIGIQEPVVVCGLSMGGYIALALYRKYPLLFRGLILTSTRAGADSPEGKSNRELAIKNVLEHGVASIVDGMLPKIVSPLTLSSKPQLMSTIRNIMLETSVNGIIGASQGMRDRLDSTILLPQITVPVLIVHGAEDQIIPLSEAQAMQSRIPHAQLAVIPGAGHLLNMEQPDKFNNVVREYIKSLP